MATFDGVGDDGERKRKHSRPCTSYKEIACEENILVVDEISGYEPDTTEHKTEGIDEFPVLEKGNDNGPNDRPNGLYGKENADPVSRILILRRFHVDDHRQHAVNHFLNDRRVECLVRHGSVRVGPHIHECRPAEELHKSYRPELRRCLLQQRDDIATLLLCPVGTGTGMILLIDVWRVLLHLDGGVDDT